MGYPPHLVQLVVLLAILQGHNIYFHYIKNHRLAYGFFYAYSLNNR